MLRLASVMVIVAVPLAAQPLDGRYFWTGDDPARACDPQAFNEAAITLAGDTIEFVESRCSLTNPVSIRGMDGAFLYDAQCAGEGETWTERMLVYPTYDGVAVLSRGAARSYTRCP